MTDQHDARDALKRLTNAVAHYLGIGTQTTHLKGYNYSEQVRKEMHAAHAEAVTALAATQPTKPEQQAGGVPAGLLRAIRDGMDSRARLDSDYACTGCGRWNPHGHPEGHGHDDNCAEFRRVVGERNTRKRLDEVLAAAPSQSAVQADCAGGSPCTDCPDKKLCRRGCIRQPEFIGQDRTGGTAECDSVDALLRGLGLDPDRCRTEGGALNVWRTLSLLQDGCTTPQDATPGAAVPLTLMEIAVAYKDGGGGSWLAPHDAFERGVQFAEKHHGITTAGPAPSAAPESEAVDAAHRVHHLPSDDTEGGEA